MLGIEARQIRCGGEEPHRLQQILCRVAVDLSSSTMATTGPSGMLVVSAIVENRAIAQGQVDYGTITAIEIYRASDNQPINTGTVLGGIAGGVIGHQIASDRGNTAATIAGTIGGAVVGNQIEKNKVQGSRYRISVKLDSMAAIGHRRGVAEVFGIPERSDAQTSSLKVPQTGLENNTPIRPIRKGLELSSPEANRLVRLVAPWTNEQ